MKKLNAIADFLFEVGILSKTPRSGFYFLGSGQQSVAEHINRVTIIGYVLSKLKKQANEEVDEKKVLEMCLFHDLPEARTSDLNYTHQKYARADESKAVDDLASTLPFGEDIKALINERNGGDSIEARLARDADQLELILSLKEQLDIGNERAKTWIPLAVKRLNTKEAQALAITILETPSDNWWFHDKEDPWWVSRDKNR
ncbi:phosphohydrolase [Candidatus Falkowbacteria bacterium RIFOXYC2_FULL_47_12]|uniref:Phosphohydrolase n=2 Tax=Candidatus Falkowiibacteriota TaxID=1752728 RepID=A0A1F5TLG4_9BACT|nr:MAG: phosphohydrolase [Candidatus Falkowbacteria bacterium RIFOXYA2_FULL_47_9]OGF39760.1 MAG: phosphohydrolase [Candidatus Falkowbacteria bacterium RIFOXYC2_FULL_47_12]